MRSAVRTEQMSSEMGFSNDSEHLAETGANGVSHKQGSCHRKSPESFGF